MVSCTFFACGCASYGGGIPVTILTPLRSSSEIVRERTERKESETSVKKTVISLGGSGGGPEIASSKAFNTTSSESTSLAKLVSKWLGRWFGRLTRCFGALRIVKGVPADTAVFCRPFFIGNVVQQGVVNARAVADL